MLQLTFDECEIQFREFVYTDRLESFPSFSGSGHVRIILPLKIFASFFAFEREIQLVIYVVNGLLRIATVMNESVSVYECCQYELVCIMTHLILEFN